MVEAGEGVALVPACVQQLRSNDVSFHPLLDRGCVLDVILAWRRNEPDAIRDGFLNLLRKNRPTIVPPTENVERLDSAVPAGLGPFLEPTQRFVLGYIQPSAFADFYDLSCWSQRLTCDAG
jgi:hypothetical protein